MGTQQNPDPQFWCRSVFFRIPTISELRFDLKAEKWGSGSVTLLVWCRSKTWKCGSGSDSQKWGPYCCCYRIRIRNPAYHVRNIFSGYDRFKQSRYGQVAQKCGSGFVTLPVFLRTRLIKKKTYSVLQLCLLGVEGEEEDGLHPSQRDPQLA